MSRSTGVTTPRESTSPTLVLVIVLLLLPPVALNAQTELRVGAYINPPKVTVDEAGNVSGILGDLLQTIANAEGWYLHTVPCDWNECLDMLDAALIDLMPDVALTEARAQRFSFHTVPTLLSWSQIYTAPGRPISSIFGLDGLRVAVLAGSVQESYLQELVDSFDLSVEWILVDTFDEGFNAIRSGRADATAANHFYGNLQVAEAGVESSPVMFEPSRLFYAASLDRHEHILANIDARLIEWQQDTNSPYFEILARWLPDQHQALIPSWIWWISLSLFTALLLALGLSHLLNRKVIEKTRHLHESEQRLSTILDSVEACIYIKDKDHRYQYVNHKTSELFHTPVDQILGCTDDDFFDHETTVRLRANDVRVLEAGERVADEETNRLRADESTRTFFSIKMPLTDQGGNIYALCGISTDITEHRRIQHRLHQLAFYDPLTGLANRRLLIDRLQHALTARRRTGAQGALLIIDIDNFKAINDTLGLTVGDQLLKHVAQCLKGKLGSTHTVARLSADEFVIVVRNLDQDVNEAMRQAMDYAELLYKQLTKPVQLEGSRHDISVSMGIATFSDIHDNVDDMLKNVDLALTAAKRTGRGTIRLFDPDMQTEVNRRSSIEVALRDAIANNTLTLHVQPQVNNQSRIVGIEGLLRWNDTVLGQVPPSEFIPIAESTGLIVPIGQWVLRQAGYILRDWATLPNMRQTTLAINISPEQFRHPQFVEDLETCITEFRFDPSHLELEITEGMLIDNPEQTAERMHELRSRGLRFSLDDFGTGYASLGYLKRLPLQQLKIDQSFVRDLLTDPNDEAIVRTDLTPKLVPLAR